MCLHRAAAGSQSSIGIGCEKSGSESTLGVGTEPLLPDHARSCPQSCPQPACPCRAVPAELSLPVAARGQLGDSSAQPRSHSRAPSQTALELGASPDSGSARIPEGFPLLGGSVLALLSPRALGTPAMPDFCPFSRRTRIPRAHSWPGWEELRLPRVSTFPTLPFPNLPFPKPSHFPALPFPKSSISEPSISQPSISNPPISQISHFLNLPFPEPPISQPSHFPSLPFPKLSISNPLIPQTSHFPTLPFSSPPISGGGCSSLVAPPHLGSSKPFPVSFSS